MSETFDEIVDRAMTEAAAVAGLSECGHKDYVLGCRKCFVELKALGEGTVAADMVDAQIVGATLMAWNIMLALKKLEDGAHRVITQSLDLRDVGTARSIQANLMQVSDYLFKLIKNPETLATELAETAQFINAVKVEIANKAATATVEPPAPSGIVMTD